MQLYIDNAIDFDINDNGTDQRENYKLSILLEENTVKSIENHIRKPSK